MSETDQDSEITDVRDIEGFNMLNRSKQEEIEAKFREQKKMKELQIDDYNPWGKPGNGAPNEDTLRKRKIFMDVLPPVVLKPVGNDATAMGRPGGGAPVRTKSGRLKNARVEDPQLRFQWHGPVRKMVDIDLRYRVPLAEQKAYKEELDQMVKGKKSIEREKAMEDEVKDLQLEEITGGIELEPLLAIRRRKAKRWPLKSTDVTGVMDVKSNFSISDKEYSDVLDHQISDRDHHKQEEKEEDVMTARKHFENWDTFWGRPGHGAPRPIKVKENLEYILYQLPILIKKDQMGEHEDEDHDERAEK